jgi:hypothetical protein
MGVPLADPQRVWNWLGIPDYDHTSPDGVRAAEVVSTISDLVRGEAGQGEWTLANVPANVSAIVLMVAVECFSNPDNKSSVTIDDVTRRWENGDLFSTSQLATIRSFRPGRVSGLSTAQFTRGLDAPSIALPDGTTPPPFERLTESAAKARVMGGQPVVMYDGRGY